MRDNDKEKLDFLYKMQMGKVYGGVIAVIILVLVAIAQHFN